jgi:nucleotide-binding universal stress UspA family protein
VKRVLVEYESSPRGRAALLHALHVVHHAGAELTVVAVATRERVVGCARCRQSAVLWNREMASVAQEALDEAATIVGARPGTRYAIAYGDRKQALAEAAAAYEAELVVVPWEPTRGLRRRFSAGLAEYLSRDGRWEVTAAPVAAPDDREASGELDVVVTAGRDGLRPTP